MTWTHEPANWAYTLVSGDIHCRVWRTDTDDWAAAISFQGMASASCNFKTVEEAQAWCEEQIAKA